MINFMEKAKKKIIGQDINKNFVELDISKMKFRISVNGVLVENNKVLLSKQKGFYFLPGGGMEICETIEETLVREFKEETGYEVKMGEIVECRHDFWLTYSSEQCNMILLYYLVKRIGGELSTDGFDDYEKQFASLAEWINIDEIEKIEFYNSRDSRKIIYKAVEILKRNGQ